MSYEYRDAINAFAGTLSQDKALSDTTLVSDAFQNLPTDYATTTPGKYLPLVLNNFATGASEVVWVVGHSVGSATVSVLRGKESTSAQPWPAGTSVTCAPTAKRDSIPVVTTGTLPTDPHLGLEAVVTDKGELRKRGLNGWFCALGAGIANNFGTNMSSVSPPDGAVLDFRASRFAGTASGTGVVSLTYKTAFPTQTLGVWVTSLDVTNAIGPFVLLSATAAGCSIICFNGTATRVNGVNLSFQYLALGW